MSRFAHEHPDDPEGAMESMIDRADHDRKVARENAPSLTDEIFNTVRSATAALYPEARIPETPMPDHVVAKFPGRVTYSLSQYNQTIELKYAHQQQPTTQDVERMAAMLQSLASSLLKEFGKAELLP